MAVKVKVHVFLKPGVLDVQARVPFTVAFLAGEIVEGGILDWLGVDAVRTPKGALDRDQIMRALRRLCDEQGRTVVLVVHDINFAAAYSDHIVALKAGAVHCQGPVDQVVTAAHLQALYGFDIDIVQAARGLLCNYFNPQGEIA